MARRQLSLLAELSGKPPLELQLLASATIELFGISVVVWRDDPTGSPVLSAAVSRGNLRKSSGNNLVSLGDQPMELGKRKLRPTGWAAFNAARIEAGRPMFGIDFDDTVLPGRNRPDVARGQLHQGLLPGPGNRCPACTPGRWWPSKSAGLKICRRRPANCRRANHR